MMLKVKRCSWKIGSQKVRNYIKTIVEIVKPEVFIDDAYLDHPLEVLNANISCHIHIDKRPLENITL